MNQYKPDDKFSIPAGGGNGAVDPMRDVIATSAGEAGAECLMGILRQQGIPTPTRVERIAEATIAAAFCSGWDFAGAILCERFERLGTAYENGHPSPEAVNVVADLGLELANPNLPGKVSAKTKPTGPGVN